MGTISRARARPPTNAVVWITWDRGSSWYPGKVLGGREAPRNRVLVHVFNNPFGPYLFPLSSIANYLDEHTHLRKYPRPEMRLAVEAADQYIRREGIAEQKARLMHPNVQVQVQVSTLPAISARTKPEFVYLRLRIRQPRLLERFAAGSANELKRSNSAPPKTIAATIRADDDTAKSQKKCASTNAVPRSDSAGKVPASSNMLLAAPKASGAITPAPQWNTAAHTGADKAAPSTTSAAPTLVKSESKPPIAPITTKLTHTGGATSFALEHPASHVVGISMTRKPPAAATGICSPVTPTESRDGIANDETTAKRMPWHTASMAPMAATEEQGLPPAKRARLSAKSGTAVPSTGRAIASDYQRTVTELSMTSATTVSVPNTNVASASPPVTSSTPQRTVTSLNGKKQQLPVAKTPPTKVTATKRASTTPKKVSPSLSKVLATSAKRTSVSSKKQSPPICKVPSTNAKRGNAAAKKQSPSIVKVPPTSAKRGVPAKKQSPSAPKLSPTSGKRTAGATKKQSPSRFKVPPPKVTQAKRAAIALGQQEQPKPVELPAKITASNRSTVPPASPATPVSLSTAAVPSVPTPTVSLQPGTAVVMNPVRPPPAAPAKSNAQPFLSAHTPNGSTTVGRKRPRQERTKSAFSRGLEEIFRNVRPQLENVLRLPCKKESVLLELETANAEHAQANSEYEQLRKRCSLFIERRNAKANREQELLKRSEDLKLEVARQKATVEDQERQITANKKRMIEFAMRML